MTENTSVQSEHWTGVLNILIHFKQLLTISHCPFTLKTKKPQKKNPNKNTKIQQQQKFQKLDILDHKSQQ